MKRAERKAAIESCLAIQGWGGEPNQAQSHDPEAEIPPPHLTSPGLLPEYMPQGRAVITKVMVYTAGMHLSSRHLYPQWCEVIPETLYSELVCSRHWDPCVYSGVQSWLRLFLYTVVCIRLRRCRGYSQALCAAAAQPGLFGF